jgi:hypothetical protein
MSYLFIKIGFKEKSLYNFHKKLKIKKKKKNIFSGFLGWFFWVVFLGGFFYCQPWLKAKYTFCCAPINRRMPFVNTMFLKMARQFSRGDVISFDWLCSQVRRSSLGRIRIQFLPDPDPVWAGSGSCLGRIRIGSLSFGSYPSDLV